jgi:hypothetical protein
MFRRRGYELAPVSGVEPLRSAFVARSPKSLGPRVRSDGCGGWTCTTTDRFMRPGHRYLCYATEDRKPHGGSSAAATGVVASLDHAVHALAFADEAHNCIRPAVDMQPLAVAHAIAVGCDVDHVAEALRLQHTIS